MIIKFTGSHKEELLNFVDKEKEINLFIIGDIENYGFDKDFLEVWGEIDDKGNIKAVLLSYYKKFIVYSRTEFDVIGFSEIMKKNDFEILSGEKSIVDKFSKYIDVDRKREMHFAKLNNSDKLYQGQLIKMVIKTHLDDMKKLYDLQRRVNEGENIPPLELLEKKYIDNTGRGYHIKNHEGEIISSAETGVENSSSAMVMGVCTDNNFGGRGYATAVISKLCRELIAEGKSLCLFYDNPEAGKIYKRLGFEDIGLWSMWIR